jgi:hypothetical protein
MTQWIEVARYLDRPSAEVARGMLESCGLQALVAADNEGGMAPHLSYATGVRLMVPLEDDATARSLLAAQPEGVEAMAESTAAIESAPAALEISADHKAKAAWRFAIIAFVTIPVVLHVYSLFKALQALEAWPRLSAEGRRQALQGLAVSAAVLGVVGWLVVATRL